MRMNNIIIALDFSSFEKAIYFIDLFKDHIKIFKIGLQLFISDGQKIISYIKDNTDCDIFLDLKLYDIPSTVGKAVKEACKYNPKFLTISIVGGKEMLQQAIDNCNTYTTLLGVTILSSDSNSDISILSYRANLAKEAGLNGYICSPIDIKYLRDIVGENAIIVSPGIRLQNNNHHDQVRVDTPENTIKNGADYIVIGRAITLSSDPLNTYNIINRNIKICEK